MVPEQMVVDPNLTFEKWQANAFVQPLNSSETLDWKDIRLNISQLQPTERQELGPLSDNHFLILLLEGDTRIQSSALSYENIHDESQQMGMGSFHLYPAGIQVAGRWYQPVTAAFLQLPPALIMQFEGMAFRRDPAHIEIVPRLNFHDPLLHHLITELCRELQNPGPLGALFAESAAQLIMLQMLRKYSNIAVTLPPTRARLTERQLRVINDYVESHLDRKLSLAELAGLLFMSLSHFERLFRASVGCSPYRYVLNRKIERARGLLLNTSLSLQQIAEACGFANQSHFTRHFTRQVGVSPARFRGRL